MSCIKDIVNFRELGGYLMQDGSRIRNGLLLRGGSLAKVSDETLRILSEDYHLAHVFDFRTETEVRLAPDRAVSGAENIWLPAIDPQTEHMADRSFPQEAYLNIGPWLVQNSCNKLVQEIASHLYSDMIMNEYTQLQYAAFLQTIVNTPEGAVFWHCSQGKDRTGLGAAFLLCALGADRQVIMEDYNKSMDFYREEYEMYASQVATPEEKEVLLTFVAVNARYFEAGLDLIEKRFGSLDAYVEGPLCLTGSDKEILKSRYLEK